MCFRVCICVHVCVCVHSTIKCIPVVEFSPIFKEFWRTSSWPSTGNFSDNSCWIADHSILPHPILDPSEETEWLADHVSEHLTVVS